MNSNLINNSANFFTETGFSMSPLAPESIAIYYSDCIEHADAIIIILGF